MIQIYNILICTTNKNTYHLPANTIHIFHAELLEFKYNRNLIIVVLNKWHMLFLTSVSFSYTWESNNDDTCIFVLCRYKKYSLINLFENILVFYCTFFNIIIQCVKKQWHLYHIFWRNSEIDIYIMIAIYVFTEFYG